MQHLKKLNVNQYHEIEFDIDIVNNDTQYVTSLILHTLNDENIIT